MRLEVYNSYTKQREIIDLPRWKYLFLRLVGKVYLEHRSYPGWRGKSPFYIFHCPHHGYILDYPHGENQVLYCELCEQELDARLHRKPRGEAISTTEE